jgi:hypothetical protein
VLDVDISYSNRPVTSKQVPDLSSVLTSVEGKLAYNYGVNYDYRLWQLLVFSTVIVILLYVQDVMVLVDPKVLAPY